jgi:hypothetical protein
LTATATEVDVNGNINSASVNESVTATAPAPAITAISSQGNHWNPSGTATANATVTVFNNGSLVGTTVANSGGNWTFNNAGLTGSVDSFTAVVNNVSSAAWIEGTSGGDTFSFALEADLAAPARIIGNGGVDTIAVTGSAVTLIDADFSHVSGVQNLQLTGAGDHVSLGAAAQAAGIATVITGTGDLNLTDTGSTAISVNAAALANNAVLTVSGSSAEVVTGLIGDLNASGLSGNLSVTAAHNTVDHGISITTGSAATSITDSFSDDTVSVNASSLATGNALTLSGSAAEVVTGLDANINAAGLTGSLNVTAGAGSVAHNITINTGSGATSVTDNDTSDTVKIVGTSGSNTISTSGTANFTVSGVGGGDTLNHLGTTGHDTFAYLQTSDSKPGAGNFDVINGFIHNSDKIDFSAITSLTTVASANSTPASIAAHTIEIVTSGGNTTIYANATNSSESTASADMEIHLLGVTSITPTDITHH